MIDRATIYCQSGSGGKGQVSFRREKCIPFGGPDGGDGGKGGSVIIQGSRSINNLLKFKYHRFFRAKNGQHGRGDNCYGSNGNDLTLQLPLGTDIYDHESKQLVYSVTTEDKFLLLKGGNGGIGNGKLATSTNRTPRYAIDNQEGVGKWFYLSLRLIGDIAIIGLPNAGKSSLINAMTNSKSLVGDYAFTTMKPIVGVTLDKMILIDLPGIIKGAAQGKGLGNIFLSHAERSKMFIVLLDIKTALQDIDVVLSETKQYNLNKKIIIVCNKVETIKRKKKRKIIRQLCCLGYKVLAISIKYKIGLFNLRTTMANSMHTVDHKDY